MDAPQWSLLRQCLLDRGWTARDDSLYAPHETLWFIDADQADLVSFRACDGLAPGSDGAHATRTDRGSVHEDLLSLVQALDDALESRPEHAYAHERDAAPTAHSLAFHEAVD